MVQPGVKFQNPGLGHRGGGERQGQWLGVAEVVGVGAGKARGSNKVLLSSSFPFFKHSLSHKSLMGKSQRTEQNFCSSGGTG